ncbi:hypothetical protein GDO86_013675 [Hymenochirus boettgeri]|uniref:Nanos-type domain-containing protein n=1 Tax=Hymenochirus boettgeri TaxID=247094 RepID=A0A8T2IZI7_9PIPI|nr:hypothetical protein GDO86_013675 [Hymenochirus boettgeri]
MDGGFDSWGDYLGLSALIRKGLQVEEEMDGPAQRWSFSSPISTEPLPSKKVTAQGPVICRFCQANRETVTLYRSHPLRGPDGRVLCPVLRGYTCTLCGANGDWAHTLRYCPLRRVLNNPCSLRTRHC